MKNDGEVRVLASRLVEVLGEDAARHALCRLVELTAANETRAAAFWRDVMHVCEELAAGQAAPPTVRERGQAADILGAGD